MENKMHYPVILHKSPDHRFIEFMCYPAAFCQSIHTVIEQYFSQTFGKCIFH